MRRLCCTFFLVAFLITTHSFSQTEHDLKQYFEGNRVVVKIEMPATSQGVDIHPLEATPMNFGDYTDRIKKHGIALYPGDNVMVTKIKVKKKHIEFQLGGGGYGTFWDEGSHVSAPTVSKSEREKYLEKAIDKETDKAKKQDMKSELDDLRRSRELEQDRLRFEAEQASNAKKAGIREQALQSGSRFNIRYDHKLIAQDLYPERIKEALRKYVDFDDPFDTQVAASTATPTAEAIPGASSGELRKGMLWEEAATALGAPSSIDQRQEGSLTVMVCTYNKGNQRITTEFVEGVLIRYSIASQ